MMTKDYTEYTQNESRFFSLKKISEERFKYLTNNASEFAKARYEKLNNLAKK